MNRRRRGDKTWRGKKEQLSKTHNLTEQLRKTNDLTEQLGKVHNLIEQLSEPHDLIEQLSKALNLTKQLDGTNSFIEQVRKAPGFDMSISMDRLYGNTWSTYSMVPHYHGKPETFAEGIEGLYDVMITLMSPTMSTFSSSLDINQNGIMGGSLLILDHEVDIDVSTPHGNHRFQLLPNEQARLGLVKLQIDASDMNDAEMKGMDIAQPFLSLLSVAHNTSLSVHAVTIKEQSTGVTSITAGITGREKHLNIESLSHLTMVNQESIADILSAYREALNAQDAFQKIISLWRVFEGLTAMRNSMIKAAPADKRRDLFPKRKLPVSIEDIPKYYRSDPSHGLFEQILGKSHQNAIEQFQSEYRDAVAHLSLDDDKDGTSRLARTADSWRDVKACWRASQVIEYVLRDYLKLIFSGHRQYRDLELTED